jgi:hypothetical protein
MEGAVLSGKLTAARVAEQAVRLTKELVATS